MKRKTAARTAERGQAEEALRRSEEQYRSVVDNIRQVIFKTDARGRFTFLNAAWTEITGFAGEETLGTSFLRYVHPDDRQRHAEVFQPLIEHKNDYFGLVARYLTKAGSHRWIEVFGQLIEDGGAIRGMFGTLTDITERRRAEQDLTTARARLQHLLVSSPAVIYSCEAGGDFTITFVGDNITRQLGYTVDEVLDDPAFWVKRVHPEDVPGVRAAFAALVERGAGEHQSHQYRFRHKDGTYRWIHDQRRLVRDATGHAVEIVGSWVDVTEHRRTEEERGRLSSVVEQSTEAIVITALDGTIEYVNQACERLTGYSRAELHGQNPSILKSATQDPQAYRQVWATLAGGGVWSGHLVNRRKDGSPFDAQAVISPVRDGAGRLVSYVAGMRDVTHERQVEEQLRQAQKMEIAGRLAGGVAHDFNNLLTVIGGRSQIMLQRLKADDPHRRDVELILETAQRAAALTRQLLVFSRKQMLAPVVLDLNSIVANMDKMLRRLIGEDVDLVTVAGADVGRVKADPSQLEQVVMNLVVNARDAMPLGGSITLETSTVELDAAYARQHVDVRPGAYVVLAVTDTGSGIEPETKAHIFEPFFTTKAPDKGTGLGLSTVYGIVAQSDGHITVESEPGHGATFRIYLPRVTETARRDAAAGSRVTLPRGSETILLTEDEEHVRELALEVLRMSGYTVLEASDGASALELSARHAGPIHLLVTDIVMPHMGGGELAQRLTRLRPEMRVLYMSGYTDDALVRHGVAASEAAMIEKPFATDGLVQKVRAVLEAPREARPSSREALVLAHGRN